MFTMFRSHQLSEHAKTTIERSKDPEFYVKQGSEKWLLEQHKYITSTHASGILGYNPWSSPQESLISKMRLDNKQNTDGQAKRFAWGHTHEPTAIKIYMQVTGKKVYYDLPRFLHKIIEWLAGSPDGITADGILIEIKCPYCKIMMDQCPIYYYQQVQFLLEITDLEICHFVCFIPKEGNDDYPATDKDRIKIMVIMRDRTWFKKALPYFDHFFRIMQYVKRNPHQLHKACSQLHSQQEDVEMSILPDRLLF